MTPIEFRSLERDDLPTLFRWLREPHVAQWWNDVPTDLAAVEAEYGPCIDGDDPGEQFVVTCDGRPVGMIQRYLFADEVAWTLTLTEHIDVTNAAGIDYLIGEPDLVGKGIGTAMIQAFTADTFAWRPIDQAIANVDQTNLASWRILEKAGYRRMWSGELDSPDPSDTGPQHVYVLARADLPAALR
jgi:aminoglycoside 6'-N-acetyltransferase